MLMSVKVVACPIRNEARSSTQNGTCAPPTPGQRRKDAHTSLAAALSAPRGHEDYDFTTMV